MPNLIYGAPEHSADLFHEIPTPIIDPFLYLETNGRRAATVSVLDADKVRPFGIEVIDPAQLGRDELIAQGLTPSQLEAETCLRACRELGISAANVPVEFPLGVADHLRAAGVELSVDPDAFVERRRRKSETELAGIR